MNRISPGAVEESPDRRQVPEFVEHSIKNISDEDLFAALDLREAELFLRDSVVRRWVEDGRWEELSDSFARGEKHLTLSYLIVKARKLAAAYEAE